MTFIIIKKSIIKNNLYLEILYLLKVNKILRFSTAVSFVTTLVTVNVLRALSPKFGQLIAVRQQRKGYLRYIHSRVIQNAEEIAFYGGEKVAQLFAQF